MTADRSAPGHWLLDAAAASPRATALVLPEGRFDFAALASLVGQLCHLLESRGLGAGAVLAVESRSPTLLTLLLHTALLADLVLLPLDPRLPDSHRRALLRQARPDLLVLEDDTVRPEMCRAHTSAAQLLTEAAQVKPLFAVRPPPSAERRRLLMASSGSHGAPHLVALSDANLAASVAAVNTRFELGRNSCWLACLPLTHIGGLAIPLRCAAAGAAVVLHQGFDVAAVLADLHRLPVTHLSLVPAMLAQLLQHAGTVPPAVRVVLVGGAPLEPSLAQSAIAAGWPLWVSYGMTETASTLCARRLSRDDPDPQCVGRPLEGFGLRIVDQAGRTTSEEGVIEVRGAAVHGSRHGVEGRWYATGDRGCMDARGRLHVLGRDDLVLLSGGEKVHPEAVERLLCNCPGVDEVAVTGQPDPHWGQRVVAVYRGDIDELRFEQLCRRSLDGAMRPRRFIRVAALPRTASGKLDRAALRELVRGAAG